MTLLNGSIFSLGFRIALQGDNNPVMPPSAAQVPKYLHLVDADGNTLVPVLVPDGLTTPEGPVAGLRWTIPFSAAGFAELEAAVSTTQSDIAALEARVAALEITLAAATAAATPDTLAKRNIAGDLAVNLVRPIAVRATADNVGVSLEANDGGKGVEVVQDLGVRRLGFFGVTPQARPVYTGSESVGDLIDTLAAYGLIEL